MKKLKAIYKYLAEGNKGLRESETLSRHRGYLNSYLNDGMASFTYNYINNYGFDRSLTYHIIKVLSDIFSEVGFSLEKFILSPNKDSFLETLDKAYYLSAAGCYYAFYQQGEDMRQSDSIFALLMALTYFPEDEQRLTLAAMLDILPREGEFFSIEEMDASKTIIPLALHIAKDTLSLSGALLEKTDKMLNSLSFSPLYQMAYDNFLSTDQQKIQQLFTELSDYHLKQCNSEGSMEHCYEFEGKEEQVMPWEILLLLRLRAKKGLDNSFIQHPLIDPFLPFIGNEDNFVPSEDAKKLRTTIFKEWGYKPIVEV